MKPKRLLGKTYRQYSRGALPKEGLKEVALKEARSIYGKPHRFRLFFLRTAKWGVRALGYPLAGIVGASSLVPLFLSIGPMASNVPAYLKYLYGGSLASGAAGLGLTSYYIGSATRRIVEAIKEKVELWKYIEKTDPEIAVDLFMKGIEHEM